MEERGKHYTTSNSLVTTSKFKVKVRGNMKISLELCTWEINNQIMIM